MKLRKQLKVLRIDKEHNLKQASKELKITRLHLSFIEHGWLNVPKRKLLYFKKYYKLKEEDFYRDVKLPNWSKITIISFISLLAFFGLLIGSINTLKFAIFHEYYGVRKVICGNPGLNEGFVPQGITISTKENVIYTSGYMSNMKDSSRIYETNLDTKKVRTIKLKNSDGSNFIGHCGGLTYTTFEDKEYLLLANIEYDVYKLSLDEIKEKDEVNVGNAIVTKYNGDDLSYGNAGDYIFSDDEYIYVGEFNNDKQYPRKNEIKNSKNVIHRGAIYRYSKDDFFNKSSSNLIPNLIYSVPNLIQGFAFDNDKYVLSSSWGIGPSHYSIYDKKGSYETIKYHNIDTIFFDNPTRDFIAPPMAEDLCYKDGLFYNMNESASNKYLFGKLFNAWNIVGLKL